MNPVKYAKKLRPIIEQAAQGLDDQTALEAKCLHPVWAAGAAYAVGHKVQHGGRLWKVLHAHTSQDGWEPENVPALFARVLIPDGETIPEWVQPDSTNPYAKGDKVTHNGKTWVSDYDNNVWEPGVFGWSEVST